MKDNHMDEIRNIVPRYHADAILIAKMIRDMGEDDQLTYDAISEAVGYNIQNDRRALNKARKMVRSEVDEKCTVVVRGVGIRWAKEKDVLQEVEQTRVAIRRKAGRGIEKVRVMPTKGLTDEQRIALIADCQYLHEVKTGGRQPAIDKRRRQLREQSGEPVVPMFGEEVSK